MISARTFTRAIPLLTACSLCVPAWVSTANAGLNEAAVLFLAITNSPRANGMGGCAITLVDDQSALYNPGALGLYHTNRVVSIALPDDTRWLPGLTDDLGLRTYSISAGVSSRLIFRGDQRLNVGIGVAYSKHRLDLGQQTRTDEFGNILGTFGTWERAEYYTVGMGVEYYGRLGVGMTHKTVTSHLGDFGSGLERGSASARGSATDYGVLAELPLAELFPHQIFLGSTENYPLSFDVTPSVAYVYANSGDEIAYIDAAQADPIPAVARTGVSVYGAARIEDAVLVSARLAWQRDESRVGTPQTIYLQGTEIGLCNIVFLRWGHVDDEQAGVFYDTKGYGFSLAGVLAWLRLALDVNPRNPYLRFVMNHADLTYDRATYEADTPGTPIDGTEFVRAGFSF